MLKKWHGKKYFSLITNSIYIDIYKYHTIILNFIINYDIKITIKFDKLVLSSCNYIPSIQGIWD